MQRASVVCPFDSENQPSIGEPGIQLPATVAAIVSTAPINDACTTAPLLMRYMYRPTNSAIGIVQAIVKVPHDEPGTSTSHPGGRMYWCRSFGLPLSITLSGTMFIVAAAGLRSSKDSARTVAVVELG